MTQTRAVRAVFLDAGYTLLRVEPSTGHHYAAAGREIAGFEAEPDAYDRMFGRAMAEALTDEFAPSPEVDDESERTRWRRFTSRLYGAMGLVDGHEALWIRLERVYTDPRTWVPFEDTVPLLDALDERGIAAVIVSNWTTHLRRILEHHGLLPRMAAMIGSCEVGVEKPDPRIFGLALRALDIRPEQAIHVGDSVAADVEGARAAGIRPLLLDRQRRYPDHPDRIDGLLEILDRL